MSAQNAANASSSFLAENTTKYSSLTEDIYPLIDARKILDGGIGVYTQNLIEGLLEKGVKLCAMGEPEVLARFPWYDLIDVEYEKARSYSLDEMLALSGRHDLSKYSLFHTPHYVLPLYIPIPSVITVHDLIHIHYPEKWYYPFVANRLLSSSVKRADAVITVSNATRGDLEQFLGASSKQCDKITVIPNAVHRKYRTQKDEVSYASSTLETKPKRQCSFSIQGTTLKGNYLLSVLSMHKPHKGLEQLLEAFKIYSQAAAKNQAQQRQDVTLVLAGSGLSEVIKDEALFHKISEMKNVQVLGRVSSEELAKLYRNARALVVASRAEGFCLPVIEAQSYGVPVIACPVPAILEILSKNDFATGGFEPSDIASCLQSVMRDLLEREPAEASAEHLARFDRGMLTEQILSVYGSIIEGEKRAAA